MIDSVVADAARAAASRLETQLHQPNLKAAVETALHQQAKYIRQERYVDAALGSLIVSIASLAYQIYKDHRKRYARRPARKTVVNAIRIKLQNDATSVAFEEEIIEVVAVEIITAARDDE